MTQKGLIRRKVNQPVKHIKVIVVLFVGGTAFCCYYLDFCDLIRNDIYEGYQFVLIAQISLTLSRHKFLSAITLGWSYRLNPVSTLC